MRASSVRATAHAIVTSGDESDQDLDTSLDQWVREPSNVRDAGSVPIRPSSAQRTPQIAS